MSSNIVVEGDRAEVERLHIFDAFDDGLDVVRALLLAAVGGQELEAVVVVPAAVNRNADLPRVEDRQVVGYVFVLDDGGP